MAHLAAGLAGTLPGRGVQPSFFPMDARELPFDAEFDVVICLCQGAFGLGLPDLQILRNIRRSIKPAAG